jgi:hypothetical protein
MIKVEQLPLWNVLKKAEDRQRAAVKELIEGAAALLDRVVETFPRYTLHNSTHAANVVGLMSQLLGPRQQDLHPLEAAFLLLSAFYHDIGMVFDMDTRARLTEEPEWKLFLQAKPDAYLAVQKAGSIPPDIAEWYCRLRHAERVYVFLNAIPEECLKWKQTSIREELGRVCESHNQNADALRALPTDFRGEADLRFCAILLRLADILDFDRSRTPSEVYDFLGLADRANPQEATSDTEWRKHLCSEGFRFPKKRPDLYPLPLIAGPDEPGVEHDLRSFLTDIDGELMQCRATLASCSDRWRDLPLPGSIDRSKIHSNGYRYGEYLFTLDQAQIMDLLMGENLYSDPYVFVRELIQNAIDTSRHRRFVEHAAGISVFEPAPIQVHQWTEPNGDQWVRFDDQGMGMNEEIIRNHLLKVGSSYYQTAGFRAEILRARERTHENFVPISRFGIGLLSCFITGSQVEINTLRHGFGGGRDVPVRLSLKGLHGFFTLQTPQLPPAPMPGPGGQESGYLTDPGTSIAVRLDPRKERRGFDLETLLKTYVSCPPVPVELDGHRIGGDPAVLVDRPWTETEATFLTFDQMSEIGELLRHSFTEPSRIIFLPIDLTANSPSHELKGQILIAFFSPTQEWKELEQIRKDQGELRHTLIYDRDLSELRLEVTYQTANSIQRPFKYLTSVQLPASLRNILASLENEDIDWLSHNGVGVTKKNREAPRLGVNPIGAWTQGIIALSDSLRPELSVSRDSIINIPWKIYSVGGIALYRALGRLGMDLRTMHWELLNSSPSNSRQMLLLGELLEDRLLRADDGWPCLPIIETAKGIMSLMEIRDTISREETVEIKSLPFQRQGYGPFLSWCAATLVQLELDASLEFTSGGSSPWRIVVSSASPLITEGHKLFPPLTFIPFLNSALLRVKGSAINASHPFSTWLIEKAPEISRRYAGLFGQIRHALTETWRTDAETLNAVLDRLRNLDPSVRPPKDLILKAEDFGS